MIIEYKALHSKVLCVAKEDYGEWSAYIGPVVGKNHDEEYEEVLKHGNKLPKAVALAIFPDFKSYRWRE